MLLECFRRSQNFPCTLAYPKRPADIGRMAGKARRVRDWAKWRREERSRGGIGQGSDQIWDVAVFAEWVEVE